MAEGGKGRKKGGKFTVRGQLGAHRLRGVGEEGEEEEGRERREVQTGNGRNQAAENVEEGISHYEEGLEYGLPGHLRVGGREGGEFRSSHHPQADASIPTPSCHPTLLPALIPALPGRT